jgi:membrane associated rhomboid family serine protease
VSIEVQPGAMSPDSLQSPSSIPLASYVLALALLAASGFASWEEGDVQSAVAGELAEAQQYWSQHPHLEPSPALEAYIGADTVAAQRRNAGVAGSDRLTQRRQDILDALMAEAAEAYAELPAWSWGLDPVARRPGTFLSHVLIHTSTVHLLGNVFLLALLGASLERTWRRPWLLPLAGGAAVVSGMAFCAVGLGEGSPMVGGNAVVAAFLGALVVAGPARVGAGTYGLLLVGAGGWLGGQLALGSEWSLVAGAGESSQLQAVWWAGAAGLGFGGVFALAIAAMGGRVGIAATRENAIDAGAAPFLDDARAAQGRNDADAAVALLRQARRAAPDDDDVAIEIWRIARDLGRQPEAVQALLTVVRSDLRGDEIERPVALWLELVESGFEVNLDPTLLIRMAALLKQAGEGEAAIDALRGVLELSDVDTQASLASRVAHEASDLDHETASRAAWKALGSTELSLHERAGLEELLGDLQSRAGSAGVDPVMDDDPGGDAIRMASSAAESESASPVPEQWEDPELSDENGAAVSHPWAISVDDAEPALRAIEVVEAIPVGIQDFELVVEVNGRGKKNVRLQSIDAFAVAVVDGLGDEPVTVIDLALNWTAGGDQALKVVRLRDDRYDPTTLVSVPGDVEEAGGDARLSALVVFVSELMDRSAATPLPNPQAARGNPFVRFASVDEYLHDVLMAEQR